MLFLINLLIGNSITRELFKSDFNTIKEKTNNHKRQFEILIDDQIIKDPRFKGNDTTNAVEGAFGCVKYHSNERIRPLCNIVYEYIYYFEHNIGETHNL